MNNHIISFHLKSKNCYKFTHKYHSMKCPLSPQEGFKLPLSWTEKIAMSKVEDIGYQVLQCSRLPCKQLLSYHTCKNFVLASGSFLRRCSAICLDFFWLLLSHQPQLGLSIIELRRTHMSEMQA